MRDPRWGRNLETPSEDPLVCGTFGTAVTEGLQRGEDARYLQAVVTVHRREAGSPGRSSAVRPATPAFAASP